MTFSEGKPPKRWFFRGSNELGYITFFAGPKRILSNQSWVDASDVSY